jgi:DNA primase catalytic subunit
MAEVSREFVYQRFSEFYKDPVNAVPAPPLPQQREFGYLTFKEKFMVRHRRFEQIATFRAVLAQTVPSAVYTAALYENPIMTGQKRWIGSDVVLT